MVLSKKKNYSFIIELYLQLDKLYYFKFSNKKLPKNLYL